MICHFNMKENKESVFYWAFVVKNPKLNGVSRSFNFNAFRWCSDAELENDTFYFVGTENESDDFYSQLIENGYSVQDDFKIKEYDKERKNR